MTCPRVRMDVAAFIGLAERGPLDRAVPLESFDEYRACFGAAGGGRLLGHTVELFFANGGRRCVVVRAAPPEARPARWLVPLILSASTRAPLVLAARDPGAWGGLLHGRFRFVVRPVVFERSSKARVILLDPTVTVGATLQRTLVAPDGALLEELGEVTSVKVMPNGKRFASLAGITLPEDGELGALHEVRLEVELAVAGVRERFADLGLSPKHRRYLVDVLREPGGSRLVVAEGDPGRLVPADGLLRGVHEHTWAAGDLLDQGDDAAIETDRRCFFEFPRGTSPLDLLDAYDDANRTAPVSLLGLPDLVHPDDVDPVDPDVPASGYPNLASSYNLATAPGDSPSARDWQAELVSRCEAGQADASHGWGRVALLDLPPGLDAGQILAFRCAVRSARGCAALFAPYLRVTPSVAVPPCGAVAGILARRERSLGVGPPANEVVRGVVSLHEDGAPPDPGLLREEPINLVRATARGCVLLGARTTSDDPRWAQLAVRRTIHQLGRQLVLDTRWAAAEQRDRILRSRLVCGVERRLASMSTSCFVRWDEAAQVIEAGVALAKPGEHLILELTQRADGTCLLGERHG